MSNIYPRNITDDTYEYNGMELEEQREAEKAKREAEKAKRETLKKQKTGATSKKGRKVSLVLLALGATVAISILGTFAIHSHNETKRVDKLIYEYTTENYVSLPTEVLSTRAYDTTISDGKKLLTCLERSGLDYICINNNFYTKDGSDIQLLTYKVKTTSQKRSIRLKSDGESIYMPPKDYVLEGEMSTKDNYEIKKVIVPAGTNLDSVGFTNSTGYELIEEPITIHTLPFSLIKDSTLICDVPDGITLDEHGRCTGQIDLVQKKHK